MNTAWKIPVRKYCDCEHRFSPDAADVHGHVQTRILFPVEFSRSA